MARLVVNPNSPQAWEIQLKPGSNSIGRGMANDFKITDPSVSGSHCQVLVEGGQIIIRDLGSTNGTFVNRAPVKEAVLQGQQIVHLGGVELAFYADLPAGTIAVSPSVPSGIPGVPTPPVPVPMAVPVPSGISAAPAPVATPGAIRVSVPPPPTAAPRPAGLSIAARPSGEGGTVFLPRPTDGPPAVAPPPVAIPGVPGMPGGRAPVPAAAGQKCKFHPKTLARYYCNQCHRFFCELCVTSRTVHETVQKTCRACGVEVAPIQVQMDRPDKISFYSRLPGSFAYPFKGSGVFVLIVCTIVTFGLGFLGGGLLSFFATMAYYGYMFAFMQGIIHSTASADEELPGWPGIDDLGGCFVRFLGAALISFAVPITITIITLFSEESTIGSTLLLPGWIFGCLYFPMALLAVAMKDTPIAANPLIVVPSIFKAPLEYLVTVILMAIILALYNSGDTVIGAIFPRGLLSHSMPKLFGYMAAKSFWFFFQLYLLAVNMRILGLLYLTKKRKLAWFEH